MHGGTLNSDGTLNSHSRSMRVSAGRISELRPWADGGCWIADGTSGTWPCEQPGLVSESFVVLA
eukprot:15461168-Alexandrium_andersonii.AAC.1